MNYSTLCVAKSGIRFEPRDLTATHPDDYPIQEYDVIAITSDGKVRHSEGTFETLDAAKAACQEFAQGETGLDQWTDVPRNEQPSESQDEEGTPKNVLGQIAVKPFYIWANDDCSNKADSFKEAKAIRLSLFNEGGKNVHIVDADGVEVVDAEIEAHEALVNAGKFEYRLLGRLQQDCEYYLGAGNRSKKHLWALDETLQIQKMKELYQSVPVKPEWITLEAIKEYEEKMTPGRRMVCRR